MKSIVLTIWLSLVSVTCTFCQPGKARPLQTDYLLILRKTADSLRSGKLPTDAELYYKVVTKDIYQRARQITDQEAARQIGTTNNDFIQTLRQLLHKLQQDLDTEKLHSKGAVMTTNFQLTIKAALQNFNRYEPPAGLSHEDHYLWVMIQILENLNQINVGFLQVELKSGQRMAVMKRLTIQHKVIEQLKFKISQ